MSGGGGNAPTPTGAAAAAGSSGGGGAGPRRSGGDDRLLATCVELPSSSGALGLAVSAAMEATGRGGSSGSSGGGDGSSSGRAAGAEVDAGASSSASASYDEGAFVAHMLAGAAAGVIEHTAMFPIDTIKTRMQALSHPGQRLHGSVAHALRAVLRREGAAGLYRGVGAVAWGAGPAHALHFAVYERAKEALGGNRAGYQWLPTAAAGATATLVNDGLMVPVDVVKQRLQVAHSPYRGVVDCAATVLRTEGVGALYRSYRTTVLMNIPFTAIHFSVYEGAKKWLLGIDDGGGGGSSGSDGSSSGSSSSSDGSGSSGSSGSSGEGEGGGGGGDDAEDRLSVQLVAGGLAGGAAAAVTTPLDVVKTRLQTEGVHSPRRYGTSAVLPVLRRIVAEEGWGAVWRGVKPRVLFNAPAAAISWGTYETVKDLLLAEAADERQQEQQQQRQRQQQQAPAR